MPSSEKTKQPLPLEFNEERLRAWKEKRAKIAAASRQERARLAEAERMDRTKLLEEQKEVRLKEAAEQRAAEEAQKRTERLQAARIRLAGRADVDAARKRLLAYRSKARRTLMTKLLAYVLAPTICVAVYLFAFATPLYEATTIFSVKNTSYSQSSDFGSGFLTSSTGHQDSAQIRAFVLSPQVMETVDMEVGFFENLGSRDVDPISRLTPIPLLQITKLDQYRRGVHVQINSQEGIIELKTRGRDAVTAESIGVTIMKQIEEHVAGQPDKSIKVLSPTTATDLPAYPRRVPTLLLAGFGFLAIFGMFSIFSATLRRHSEI